MVHQHGPSARTLNSAQHLFMPSLPHQGAAMKQLERTFSALQHPFLLYLYTLEKGEAKASLVSAENCWELVCPQNYRAIKC